MLPTHKDDNHIRHRAQLTDEEYSVLEVLLVGPFTTCTLKRRLKMASHDLMMMLEFLESHGLVRAEGLDVSPVWGTWKIWEATEYAQKHFGEVIQ